MKTIHVVAGIIKKNHKILIAQRGYGEFKGMYEFPGGKIEPGEDAKQALKRELIEEMQASIEVEELFYHVHYVYPSFILEMDCFTCHLTDDHIKLMEHLDYRWINPNQQDIPWVPADIEIINQIRQRGIF